MPYIPHDGRVRLDDYVQRFYKIPINSIGELVYLLTHLCLAYLPEKKDRNFLSYCSVVGALTCTLLEFYRRLVAPYEEEKKHINGEVY